MKLARSGLKVFAVAGLILFSASASHAATDDMPLGRMTTPPIGFMDMCRRTPVQCALNLDASPSQLDAIRQWASRTYWSVVFARPPLTQDADARGRLQGATAATEPSEDAAPSLASGSGDGSLPPPSRSATAPGAAAPARSNWNLAQAAVAPSLSRPAVYVVITPAATDAAPVAPAPSSTAKAETWQPPRFFTDLGMDRLNAINRSVNRAIRPTSDLAAFGKAEFWTVPTGSRAAGDCEDYVLAKRQALIEAGVAAEALSIAIVQTRRGELHTVLLVATPEGEVVLDNLSSWIVSWREAPYHWLQRQARGSALTWVYPGLPA